MTGRIVSCWAMAALAAIAQQPVVFEAASIKPADPGMFMTTKVCPANTISN
ncbi:MAG TPA: hypothetical protein VHC90_26200 [Bryobacteraceae bacterium]|nr:hypothetical protein [Bryobacteraceae bacterium]